MIKDSIDFLQEDWVRQRPDLNTEAMGVILRIQALAKILADQTSECLEQFGLHWWQYDVLSALRRQGKPYAMAATELADASMLTSGAMTNRIDRLEESGLVERGSDPADRRRVLVQLTGKGLILIEEATEARFATAAMSLECLTSKQCGELSNLLRVAVIAMEKKNSREKQGPDSNEKGPDTR